MFLVPAENNDKVSGSMNYFLHNPRFLETDTFQSCWACLHVLLPDWTF